MVIISLSVKSQTPVADFTSSTTSGCAALVIDFKDASTGDPKFWNWDFGNGQLSNKQNPQIAFYYPGKYTVTLVVRNANGTNGITKTDYVTVSPAPGANFTVDYNNACLPANVQFTDQSVANAGTLVKWAWDFGDGTTSAAQNPKKSYSATGFYTVSLTVTNSTGCTNISSRSRYIRVLPGVITAFQNPVTQACKPPYNLVFNNESSGPGNLSYKWNFGNGNTSTVKDPSLNITTSAPINVQLITQSDLGCSDTVIKTINVNNLLTTFTSPDSACLNAPVTFQNTSLTSVTSSWTFSDGNAASQQPTTSRTFTTPGAYTVKLVNTYSACIDSLIKTINIRALPPVDFTSNTPGACKAPLAVSFQDISPNAVSWSWNFGDGGTSTQKAPSHSYTNEGDYDVSLTITTSNGCQNTITKSKFIRIAAPVVQISNAPASGCVPYLFFPIANIKAIDGVSTYFWDFGEAGGTSTLLNPAHTYNSAGSYTIKLSITTTGGCSASVTVPNAITTGLQSFPAFTSNSLQACVDSMIQFNNLSTPAGVSYAWDFGDGQTSNLMNPSHNYATPGNYSVSLTTSNNGCQKTFTSPTKITVKPPIAKFTYKSDCKALPTVTFTNVSILDNSASIAYLWNFGDPANGTSTAANPVYQFPAKQTYNVRLTVTNGNCTNTYMLPVLLATEIADFSKSPADTICRNQTLSLQAINSIPQNISSYQWSFDGAPFAISGVSTSTTFGHNGNIPISLVVTNLGGCTDTVTKKITVIGSSAGFAPSDTAACAKSIITFSDQSTPAGSIKQWTIDYGDGTKQNYSAAPFTHQYNNAGSYNIIFSIVGKDGCSDAVTANNLVRISKPTAAFATNDTILCPGTGVMFTDFSSIIKPKLYLWNFGDGSTTLNQQNPSHIYKGKDTTYTVSLKIQDSLGCSDSLARVGYIRVTSPKSAFTISDSTTICPPLGVTFTPQAKNYASLSWNFGDNTTSNLDTPNHFYNNYGSYIAKLYVVGAGGCIDSSQHVINVNNPNNTVFTYSPLSNCNSLLVNFVVKKPANTFYNLYFGDGANDVSQKDSLQHFYNSPNTYGPYILLGDSSGCLVGVGGPSAISVFGAEPLFSPDKKSFCDSGTVYFTNYTITNDPITSSVWYFGDGDSSLEKDPIHPYRLPGRYIVSLNVTTQAGCSKSITDTIRVYKTPVPSIVGDSVVCINSPLTLNGVLSAADSTISYNWNLGNGSISTQKNPVITYTKEGSYTITLEAINILGCKGDASKNIMVAPLPVITVPQNIVAPVGAGITLPVTYTQKIKTYNWTPISGLSCINCPNPVANPRVTTNYTISVTDSNGCKSSATFTLTVVCNEKNYFVPNTFSPNGDGNNDIFYPRGNNINVVQSMRIFNRWGQMIFEKRNFAANSPADGWDGTYNGKPAPIDAYVYIVEFICENGSIIPFRGNVTLIR